MKRDSNRCGRRKYLRDGKSQIISESGKRQPRKVLERSEKSGLVVRPMKVVVEIQMKTTKQKIEAEGLRQGQYAMRSTI